MDNYKVKDLNLADKGEYIIERARNLMPIMDFISIHFANNKIANGLKILLCLHVTKETAQIAIALKESGAEVFLVNSVIATTQNEIAAALVKNHDIHVFADDSMNEEEQYNYIRQVIKENIDIIIDEGAIAMQLLYKELSNYADKIIGSVEHTAGGITRLQILENEIEFKKPIISVDSSRCKHLFDNHFGVGQTSITTLLSTVNILIPGSKIAMCGYGNCGSGIAKIVKGMGADVYVTEIDPFKALQAYHDGYKVCPIKTASEICDVFITSTGSKEHVISWDNIQKMKNGAILLNCGSGNKEIDVESLKQHAISKTQINEYVTEYELENRNLILVLADGRVANIVCSKGNPSTIMDLSFAIEALSVEYLINNAKNLSNKIHTLPYELDKKIAKMKLRAQHVFIDE